MRTIVSTTTSEPRPWQLPPVLGRIVRTPKGYLLVVLVLLALLALPREGWRAAAPGLLGALAVATVLDSLGLWLWRGRWVLPDGALLSALIVALILDPHERWYVPVATTALAICSKYIARTRDANILNPAAAALVASYFLFDSGQSWWGALPDLPPVFLLVLLGTGLFIANHVNKLPVVLVFAGGYFALFTLVAYLGDPARVAEIYRVPQINATIFLACFMLTDPPTSPVRHRDQVWFGLLVAVLSVATYLTLGGEYYLLAGLLVANLAEAGRRVVQRRRRASRREQNAR